MKGTTPSARQRRFWDALCGLGCIACRMDGRINNFCSVHHVDGRTKPWAHWFVLPLCGGHHQDGTGAAGLIAVHPWKARFEAKYGTQRELLGKCLGLFDLKGLEVPAEARQVVDGWKLGNAAVAAIKRPESARTETGHVHNVLERECVMNAQSVTDGAGVRQGVWREQALRTE